MITAGPDGNLWFVELNGNKIGRITLSGTVTEFAIPTPGARPFGGLVAGPDGAMWFTEDGANKIGRITTSGSITEFTLPNANSGPSGITRGPDGNLWFVEFNGNRIGRITPAGAFTEFSIPTAASGANDITLGPDNNLWFTEYDKGKVGRITASGSITEFALPNAGSGPNEIMTGPDGNLWFTEDTGSRIGRISTSGTLTEFPVPATSVLRDIVAAPDGNLYYTKPTDSKIGRMTTSGVVTEFDTPSANAFPAFIAVGPDGNLWFTEAAQAVNKIAVMSLQDRSIIPAVASAAGALGSLFRTGVQLHNPSATTISGRIIFHASGTSGSDSDPSLPYTLNPGETRNIADLLPAMGRSGIGSADVLATAGALPLVVARVFNDAGSAGTTGFFEETVKPANALGAGDQFVLLAPADLAQSRLNIGARSLSAGASLTVTVRNGAGTVVKTLTKSYGAAFFEQVDAATFLGGFALAGNESITVRVDSGNAIVYGAITDNKTQDPSVQLGRKLP